LLLTPVEAGALSRLMHTFCCAQLRRFLQRPAGPYRTLWEGRYEACLVDSGRYFLACCRYVELDPVRAWMVAQPGDYAWSSYGAHADERPIP
jgi:putative transposase